MSEAARQACPRCGLVYRIKKNIPGKIRMCRECGVELLPVGDGAEVAPLVSEKMEADLAAANLASTLAARETLPDSGHAAQAAASPEDAEAALAILNRVASYTAQEALPPPEPVRQNRRISPGGMTGTTIPPSEELETDLAAANQIASDSSRNVQPAAAAAAVPTARGDAAGNDDATAIAGTQQRLPAWAERLEEEMRLLTAAHGELSREVEGKLLRLLEREDAEAFSILTEKVRETGDLILTRLEECRSGREWERTEAGRAAEFDAAGLIRAMDELVREQRDGVARMDILADEIRTATGGFSTLDGWRRDLPERVADEIGRTVEARVTGPIAGALARQAPVILAELHDGKLVDIVSRAVREAQRPLVREILSGGRGGVPLWLFASILLPLLLILGYLFLPGDEGTRERDETLRAATASLARLESDGVPLTRDAEERLGNVETAVTNLHNEALTHARNAATLEEQTRNLTARLEEKEALVNEYRDTLQRQVRLLNAYRTRLTQLGVPPESIRE